MKILAVDDEMQIRETLRKVLELHGHEVTLACDGFDGVEKLTNGPDIILCDLNMPRMDGIGLLNAVRKRRATQHTHFIILTAQSDRSEQRRAMEAGADDFVTKPFTMAEVLAAIEARVERSRPVLERLEAFTQLHRHEAGSHWDHELLTPLTGIFGGAELLVSDAGKLRPSEIRELGELILESARRAENLSRKLVCHYALEKISLGVRELATGVCEPGDVVQRVALEQAKRFGRERDLGIAVLPGRIDCNSYWMAQAVEELVENAFKFSPDGSGVVVNGHQTYQQYSVEVSDHGVGMTPEQIAAIGAFRQFDRSKRQQNGLGLGLSIAKRIVELHGGEFKIGSAHGHVGLRAILALPTR